MIYYMIIVVVFMTLGSIFMAYLNGPSGRRRQEIHQDDLRHYEEFHHLSDPPTSYRIVEPPKLYDREAEGW